MQRYKPKCEMCVLTISFTINIYHSAIRPSLLNHDLQGVEKLYRRLFITSDISDSVWNLECAIRVDPSRGTMKPAWHTCLIQEVGCVDLSMETLHLKYPLVLFGC